jgi:putative acetyltransferase
MQPTLEIRQARTDGEIETVRGLFREYEKWLGLDLCFQAFDEEVRGLPGGYSPPAGRLYLALVDDAAVGCIAMRGLGEGVCEMKRLYLRSNARGLGLGNMLIERIIEDAREIGYGKMRLDTHPPKMGKAVGLYTSHGFHPIDAYYDNPHEHVLFMELDLHAAGGAY